MTTTAIPAEVAAMRGVMASVDREAVKRAYEAFRASDREALAAMRAEHGPVLWQAISARAIAAMTVGQGR